VQCAPTSAFLRQISIEDPTMNKRPEHCQLTFSRVLSKSALAWGSLLALTMFLAPAANGQTFQVIHSFTGTTDGMYPVAGVTVDSHGNLYGTTNIGGTGTSCFEGCGAAFKMSRAGSGWVFTTLYDFAGGNDDGGQPGARMIVGPDGVLYGTTSEGGGSGCSSGEGCGTVFSLQPPAHFSGHFLSPWTEKVLYRFTGGSDGDSPRSADLLFDNAGNLYGTTIFGGGGSCQDGCGAVYKLARSGSGWTESVIHSFSASGDGQQPWAGVVQDQSGNLYGTTAQGGPHRWGTVYQLIPSGSGYVEHLLFTFDGLSDGGTAYGGLIWDSAGNLYGTTCCTSGGDFTIYKLDHSQGWAFSPLYHSSDFGNTGTLVMDAAGNLYGTLSSGGAYGFGQVYKLTPSAGGWVFSSVHDFCAGGFPCTDGYTPPSGLAIDSQGNLFGTTSNGGAIGGGVVFEITP
jgi:uncharacterized repeat protein (TIGR03803 family)